MDIQGATVDGRYRVDRKIQSGYYGSTWLAKDVEKSVDVCIKTFFSEGRSQKKELLILKEMSSGNFYHINLCSVLDVCLEKAPIISWTGKIITETSYVVFEYCCGTDLFNFLVTGPFEKSNQVRSFPEPLAQHYFTQALLAVAYLHERGVFHRDIKPENCVLDGDFNLKLTDFGTNKILPMVEDPSQVIRTATKGIGTDSYRAPEVNGVIAYDPSLADVWSLGVTLFFMVAIDEMVGKVQTLDPYTRQLIAPLGIVFPFPLHCSKLDCYLNKQLSGKAPTNSLFWSEWERLHSNLSSKLIDLLNRIFHLNPANRIPLRDLAQHPWISIPNRMSSDEIVQHMQERCPSSVTTSQSASPRVLASQILGGVDQATLRSTLSSSEDVLEYPTDSELLIFSDALYRLETTQISILDATDIQEFVMDLNFCRKLLTDVVTQPHSHELRSISSDQVHSSWIISYLLIIGFLPQQGTLLYLPLDHLNLTLVSTAINILDGLEMAVFKSALVINNSDDAEMTPSDSPVDSMLTEGRTLLPISSASNDSGHSTLHFSQPEGSCDLEHQSHDRAILRRYSSDPHIHVVPVETVAMTSASNITSPTEESSQESMAWTQYTSSSWSAQSSQEECPEDFITPDSHDYSQFHRLLRLSISVNPSQAKNYRAAGVFCKLSGLLTSYGLYQVVVHQHLMLYGRGSVTSFSARVVMVDQSTGEVGISSLCFRGSEEWSMILSRLIPDMTVNTKTVC